MPSTVIRSFHYNEDKQVLTVTFVSGAKYAYENVPSETFDNFRKAYSKGNFFSHNIRDHFRFRKLPPP